MLFSSGQQYLSQELLFFSFSVKFLQQLQIVIHTIFCQATIRCLDAFDTFITKDVIIKVELQLYYLITESSTQYITCMCCPRQWCSQ